MAGDRTLCYGLAVWSEIHVDYGSSVVTRSVRNRMADTGYGVRAKDYTYDLVHKAGERH